MENPRLAKISNDRWYWRAKIRIFAMKNPETVLKEGSIVNKDNQGKVEIWNLNTSNSKGALYVVKKTTIKGVDRCACICAGEVLMKSLVLPNGVNFTTEKDGKTVLSHMVKRNHQIVCIA